MAFLVDTNIISETRKPRRSQIVMEWLASLDLAEIRTSSANLAELEYGAAKIEDIPKRRLMQTWIAETIRPWFGDRIDPIDENVLQRWLILLKQMQKSQQPTPHVDLLLASVAFEKNLIVATRDVAPFIACGVPTFNPFTGEHFNVK
jgi:toxin FitB